MDCDYTLVRSHILLRGCKNVVEVCGIFCMLLIYRVLLKAPVKGSNKRELTKGRNSYCFCFRTANGIPRHSEHFLSLYESGSELPLGILQTLNFRNESETGSTLDSRTPKSIGLLAKSQDCKQIFQVNQSLTWKFNLKTLTDRRQYRTD
jgi:hypothetical protein